MWMPVSSWITGTILNVDGGAMAGRSQLMFRVDSRIEKSPGRRRRVWSAVLAVEEDFQSRTTS
jgi:hypothetical protein